MKNISKLFLSSILLASSTFTYGQEIVKSNNIGKGLYEIAIDPEHNAVYVATTGERNANNAYIYKLDATTLATIDSIHVEKGPFGLAINPQTQKLYTSNTRNNAVTIIDLNTKKVIAEVSNGQEESHTREIIIDEKNNLVYVSDVGNPSSIWIIDGATHQYKGSLENFGKSATGIWLDDKNQIIYACLMGEGKLIGKSLKNNETVVDITLDTAGSPINLILDYELNKIYISDFKLHQVYVVDAAKSKLIKTIPVNEGPIGIEIDYKNNRIYTANRGGQSISIIDRNTLEIVKHLPSLGLSNTVKTHPKTGVTYVSNKQQSTVNRKGEPTGKSPLPNGDAVIMIQ